MGVPVLCFWIFIYPLGCLVYILIKKKEINSMDVQMRMSYYLNGYKKNYFYW